MWFTRSHFSGKQFFHFISIFFIVHTFHLPTSFPPSTVNSMRIQKIIVTNCHAVTLSHQPYLAGDGHSSMLLLWGYRRASDNAQLSFRQKIFFGRGKFSNDHSLAKSPLAPFSILSLLPPPCSVHAIYTHPVAPTITTCGSCVYTPSFLPLSPFRLPPAPWMMKIYFCFSSKRYWYSAATAYSYSAYYECKTDCKECYWKILFKY